MVIVGVQVIGDAHLFEIIGADRLVRLVLGPGEGGQEHGRQDRDDGNDHQQLDESEGFRLAIFALIPNSENFVKKSSWI